MSVGSREIAVSSCPSCMQDLFYAGAGVLRSDAEGEKERFSLMLERNDRLPGKQAAKREKKPETKFDRLQRMREAYPDCYIGACAIDTDNMFCWRKDKYRIADSASQYSPVETDCGDYYAMDRVLVVHTGDIIHCFLDQSGVLIDPGKIEKIK